METDHIENTTLGDLELIYWLFEEAIAYQRKHSYVGWEVYDQDFIKSDIAGQLQFKIVKENALCCIFSICLTDQLIWREREQGDALYLHRVVVHPACKGQQHFQKVLDWAINFARSKGLRSIRIDTWAANANIIAYYQSYGFVFLENYTTPDTAELPLQHRNLHVALLEYRL